MTKKPNQDDPVPRSRGRRQFMFGAAAAGVGLAAGLIADADPADAADGGNLKLGQSNTASATTTLTGSTGTALLGRNTAAKGIGLEGIDASPKGNGYGVLGQSANGYGVYGIGATGVGVYGTGNSDGGIGVYGQSDLGTAVWGVSLKGRGVYGASDGDSASGVSGEAFGHSGGCSGVYGINNFDPSGYGVYAAAYKGTPLYVNGNAQVTGTLSKGGGSFKIDHPLDPAHKYLYHSFVESPDMKNVYDGTVTLDGDGQAAVELPEWFETLNRDYRYQLTAIGSAAPDLHIASEVAVGKFTIAGGHPSLKVSWQVTGIRQDAWANANRIPVEADKPAHDQGRYLHPDLYENGNGRPIEALTASQRHTERPRPVTPTTSGSRPPSA